MVSPSRDEYFYRLRDEYRDSNVLIAEWLEHCIYDIAFVFPLGDDKKVIDSCLEYAERVLRAEGETGVGFSALVAQSTIAMEVRDQFLELLQWQKCRCVLNPEELEQLSRKAVSTFLRVAYGRHR